MKTLMMMAMVVMMMLMMMMLNFMFPSCSCGINELLGGFLKGHRSCLDPLCIPVSPTYIYRTCVSNP